MSVKRRAGLPVLVPAPRNALISGSVTDATLPCYEKAGETPAEANRIAVLSRPHSRKEADPTRGVASRLRMRWPETRCASGRQLSYSSAPVRADHLGAEYVSGS